MKKADEKFHDPIPAGCPVGVTIAAREKHCERCGRLIPNNGWQLDERGNVEVDEKGRGIHHKNPRLVCECWSEIKGPETPPELKRPRRRKGEPVERDPRQMTIDAPTERIK